MTTPYFQPSLQAPRAGSYVVVVTALANLPAAWLYASATAPSPSLLDPLFTLGLGIWLALVAHGAAAIGRIRHPQWMWRAGAALGAMVWYVQWAVWFVLSDERGAALQGEPSLGATVTYLCVRPDLMLVAAAGRATSGTSFVSGLAIVVVWIVELCACILPPAMAGAKRARAPFCEQTGTWAKAVHVPVQFSFINDPETVRRRLERDPRELYSVLVPCSDEAPQFADVTIHRCGGNESFVTICNFAAMTPEQVPIPALRNLNVATPEEVQYYGQVDDPIVELLRFPVQDVDALIRRWEAEVPAVATCAGASSKA